MHVNSFQTSTYLHFFSLSPNTETQRPGRQKSEIRRREVSHWGCETSYPPFIREIHERGRNFHGDCYTASLNAGMVTNGVDLLSFLPVQSYLFRGDGVKQRKSYARTEILFKAGVTRYSYCLLTGGQL